MPSVLDLVRLISSRGDYFIFLIVVFGQCLPAYGETGDLALKADSGNLKK